MGPCAARIIVLAFIVVSSPCVVQVRDIDTTKLPHLSAAVQVTPIAVRRTSSVSPTPGL